MGYPRSIKDVLKLWDDGHNCAQSTAKGLLDQNKFHQEGDILSSSFLPYGGGFKEGSICGAVSGTLAAMSFLLHQKSQDEEKIVELTNQMKSEFQKEFTSLNCHGLLEPFKDSNGEIVMDDPKRTNLCTKAVNFASFTAQEIINGI